MADGAPGSPWLTLERLFIIASATAAFVISGSFYGMLTCVADIAFTHAALTGYDAAGHAKLSPDASWQLTVLRASPAADAPLDTRRLERADGRWSGRVRRRPAGGGLRSGSITEDSTGTDPTLHDTFVAAASREYVGKAIWSDLSYSELDAALPRDRRRIVVTIQKAIDDAAGRFAGVLRVSLLTATIDALPRLRSRDEERVVLCDREGRLVARIDSDDRIELAGDDLRVVAAHAPPEIAAALAMAGRSGAVDAAGRRYLVTFLGLSNSQQWMTGVIVPEDFYTRDLRVLRARFLACILAVAAAGLLGGWLVLDRIRRPLGDVVEATRRMRRFDFAPSSARSGLREIAQVLDGVERAKTSVRALGRYVPVDLVRELFQENREPQLGGKLVEISLLFTDIEGFTTLSERPCPPVARMRPRCKLREPASCSGASTSSP